MPVIQYCFFVQQLISGIDYLNFERYAFNLTGMIMR